MGNNKGKADQGRFSSGHPKTPKPAKCRRCGAALKDKQWRRVGGKRFHVECNDLSKL